MIRSYSELMRLPTFIERYEYLKLIGQVGVETFGIDRYINQSLYKSRRWRQLRNEIIIRDNGCDLGCEGYDIYDKIIIHHLNPWLPEDLELIEEEKGIVFDPENLICTSFRTHQAIHYGDESLLPKEPIERRPGDTCPWK